MKDIYNTNVCIKYKSIEQELLMKCEHGNDCEMCKQHAEDMSLKLYKDEKELVFYNNYEENFKKLCDFFYLNNDFILKLLQYKDDLYSKTDQKQKLWISDGKYRNDFDKRLYTFWCLTSLFEADMFYVTHPFMCDFLKSSTINEKLFGEIIEKWDKRCHEEIENFSRIISYTLGTPLDW